MNPPVVKELARFSMLCFQSYDGRNLVLRANASCGDVSHGILGFVNKYFTA